MRSRSNKEILDKWINIGFNEGAVACHGTSVEKLRKVFQTGQIPWAQPNPGVEMIPYQKRLLADGGYLYYTCPFLEHIRPYNSRFTAEIEEDLAEEQRSPNYMIDTCKGYAKYSAWLDCFNQETGQSYDDYQQVLAMSGLLFPTIFRRFLAQPGVNPSFMDFDLPKKGLESLQKSIPELKKIAQECLRRRGVLIYLNGDIFKHRVVRGFEATHELLIVSTEPMTPEVVSGVEFCSNADRRALTKWVR